MREAEMIADRYRLESRIAAGGMGVVWRGTDTRVNRPVAVKLLHRDLSGSSEFRDRFAEEARLIATLNSPRVAILYDFGEFDTSVGLRSYLVLELVEGRSLSEVLKQRGPLSPAETMRIVAEAAEGLRVAHDAGIVHRDVKPANILITDDGHVKLVDFGIARAMGAAGLTETDRLIGTLAYVSPEHLSKEDPAPASDIYSLGTVAYQCLAARPPFASDKPYAVMMGILNEEPPPLPEHVPASVSDVVMRALRKDPADRWPDASSFGLACREAVGQDSDSEPRPVVFGGGGGGGPATGGGVAAEHAWTDGTTDVPGVEPPPKTPPLPETPLSKSPPSSETPPLDTPPKRRRRLVTVMAVVAATALLTAVIFVWRPWFPERDRGEGAGGESPTVAEAEEGDTGSGGPTSASGDDETGGNNDPSSAGGSGGDEGDKDDSPDPTDEDGGGGGGCTADCGTVPDLVGDYCYDTAEELRELGFSNPRPQPRSTGDFYWKIYDQSPEANSVVAKSEAIHYYFLSDDDKCGNGRANLADGRSAAVGQHPPSPWRRRWSGRPLIG